MDKDLISTYSQRSAEIAIGQLTSPFLDPKYDDLYGWDQEISSNKEIAKVDVFTSRVKIIISRA